MVNIKIGDEVICIVSGVSGVVVKQYYPAACEEQTMVKTSYGRLYHAPTRTWSKIGTGEQTMKLNREKIIKALEYCFNDKPCSQCEWHEAGNGCLSKLEQSAISLIKELTEENERLRERNIVLEQKFIILNREEMPVIKVKVKGE